MFVCVFTGSCESVGATDLTRDGDIWRLQPGGVQYYSSEYVVSYICYRLESLTSYLAPLSCQWETLLRLTEASLRYHNSL